MQNYMFVIVLSILETWNAVGDPISSREAQRWSVTFRIHNLILKRKIFFPIEAYSVLILLCVGGESGDPGTQGSEGGDEEDSPYRTFLIFSIDR